MNSTTYLLAGNSPEGRRFRPNPSTSHQSLEEHTCTLPVLRVLRVFCDSEGRFGSPLGVVLDGPAIRPERRQPLAAELGFSETVYVDDLDTGRLRIFTPAAELPFAGHPLVGTAWLLSRHLSSPVTQLNPPAGPVSTWTSDDQVWIRAPLAAAPFWRLNHVADRRGSRRDD